MTVLSCNKICMDEDGPLFGLQVHAMMIFELVSIAITTYKIKIFDVA